MTSSIPELHHTARLTLTRPTAADVPDLQALHQDPKVMATLGGLRSAAELDAMHARLFACWERDGVGWWIVRAIEDGRFVGRGGLRRVLIAGRPEVEVGYGLAAAFWGRGLATELASASVRVGFEVLQVPDLVCFTLPTNTRSRRVMEKAGFRCESDTDYAGLPHVLYRIRQPEPISGDRP
jgi:[ribosomal protein S5]-alanine N-acetyltransferase